MENVKAATYADLDDDAVTCYLDSTAMMVRLEAPANVMMNNRDVNRIVCQNGPVKDVVFSSEKGIDATAATPSCNS